MKFDQKKIVRLWNKQSQGFKKKGSHGQHSISAIAREVGCSRTWVRDVLTKRGVIKKKKGK